MNKEKALKKFRSNHPKMEDSKVYIILGNALQCRGKSLLEIAGYVKEMEDLLDMPRKYKVNREVLHAREVSEKVADL